MKLRHALCASAAMSGLLISPAFAALTFAALLFLFHAGAVEFQTAWFVVSLLTEIAIVFVLRTPRPAIYSRPHGLLVVAPAAAGRRGAAPTQVVF
jgi:Mg2+-importing ATPase